MLHELPRERVDQYEVVRHENVCEQQIILIHFELIYSLDDFAFSILYLHLLHHSKAPRVNMVNFMRSITDNQKILALFCIRSHTPALSDFSGHLYLRQQRKLLVHLQNYSIHPGHHKNYLLLSYLDHGGTLSKIVILEAILIAYCHRIQIQVVNIRVPVKTRTLQQCIV